MNMARLTIVSTILALLAFGLIGCSGSSGESNGGATASETAVPSPTPMGTLTVPPGATVELTVDGPVPSEVTVKTGSPVLFILKDEEYGQSTVKFDDSKVGTMLWLLPGESRVFTRLNDKPPGTYTYEMLTRPENKGTVIVE